MTDLISAADRRSEGATTSALPIPAVRCARPSAGAWRVTSGARVIGPAGLKGVLERFAADVATDAGITLQVFSGGAGVAGPAVRVDLTTRGLDDVPFATGLRADGLANDVADERYAIDISVDGVLIRSGTSEGVHRALTTLRQSISATATAAGVADVPCMRLVDGPRFAWRGLAVDVARTFHDPESMRRVIDMCSLYKLNVLHLHLTDDQGWRFGVPAWPLLAEVGGAGALGDRPGGYYSRDEVADLVQYASDRFVTLVPEVDLPGHVQAVFRAYPELAPQPVPERDAAAALGFAIGTLDLARGRTRQFVADVIEAAADQFPTSAYIHVGGDEAFGMADDAHAAFVDEAMAVVRGLGKRAIGWQETGRAGVGAGDVVQYWIEPTFVASAIESGAMTEMFPPEVAAILAETMAKSVHDIPEAVEKGAWVLVSPNTRLYYDMPHADPAGRDDQEATRERVGLRAYPPALLRDLVEWDPVSVTPAIDSDDRIAGVEAAVWCETVWDRDDLEFLLLPRLAGVGERGWSALPTQWDEYRRRLAPAARTWDRRGWVWFRPTSVDWERSS